MHSPNLDPNSLFAEQIDPNTYLRTYGTLQRLGRNIRGPQPAAPRTPPNGNEHQAIPLPDCDSSLLLRISRDGNEISVQGHWYTASTGEQRMVTIDIAPSPSPDTTQVVMFTQTSNDRDGKLPEEESCNIYLDRVTSRITQISTYSGEAGWQYPDVETATNVLGEVNTLFDNIEPILNPPDVNRNNSAVASSISLLAKDISGVWYDDGATKPPGYDDYRSTISTLLGPLPDINE